MKLKAIMIGLAAAAVITWAVAQAPVGGQGRGAGGRGGGRGMFGAMMYIERVWTALCFDMDLSQTQYGKLKPTFQWAYKERNTAMKKAREARSFEAAAQTMATINKTIDDRVPVVLTDAQKAAWKKWKDNEEAMRKAMRQGFGGPPGGGQGGKAGGGHK